MIINDKDIIEKAYKFSIERSPVKGNYTPIDGRTVGRAIHEALKELISQGYQIDFGPFHIRPEFKSFKKSIIRRVEFMRNIRKKKALMDAIFGDNN